VDGALLALPGFVFSMVGCAADSSCSHTIQTVGVASIAVNSKSAAIGDVDGDGLQVGLPSVHDGPTLNM
jgi:hypothetical protein